MKLAENLKLYHYHKTTNYVFIDLSPSSRFKSKYLVKIVVNLRYKFQLHSKICNILFYYSDDYRLKKTPSQRTLTSQGQVLRADDVP